MSDRAPVDRVRTAVLLLFPWLAQIKVAANVLRIRSADQRIELQGPGPAVARVGDFVARLAFFPGVPTVSPALIWYSLTPDPGPYTWVPLTVVPITGPLPTDVGSVVTISAGSARVTCG